MNLANPNNIMLLISDHNYHGVCGGLLSQHPYSPGLPGGLLHSTPPAIIDRYRYQAVFPILIRCIRSPSLHPSHHY